MKQSYGCNLQRLQHSRNDNNLRQLIYLCPVSFSLTNASLPQTEQRAERRRRQPQDNCLFAGDLPWRQPVGSACQAFVEPRTGPISTRTVRTTIALLVVNGLCYLHILLPWRLLFIRDWASLFCWAWRIMPDVHRRSCQNLGQPCSKNRTVRSSEAPSEPNSELISVGSFVIKTRFAFFAC